MVEEFKVPVAMQACFNAPVHTALIRLPSLPDAKRLCSGWFCSAIHSLCRQPSTVCTGEETSSARARRRTIFLSFFFFLTVNVPAEEVMLHQHVLHSFLQRFLLLLLQKGEFEKQTMRSILANVICNACRDGPRSRPAAQTRAIYRCKALIDGD